MRMRKFYPMAKVLATGLPMFALACDAGTSQPEATNVTDSLQQMLSAASACAAEKTQCFEDSDAGYDEGYDDAGTLQAETDSDAGYDEDGSVRPCQVDFKTCREAADMHAKPHVDRGVKDCVAAKNTCEAAGDSSVDCDAELQACLGGSVDRPDSMDAKSPVSTCVDALHACVASGAEAKECGKQVRSCVLDLAPGQMSKPATPAKPKMDDDAGLDVTMDDTMDDTLDDDAGMDDVMDTTVPSDSAATAQACQGAFDACLAGGSERAACVMERSACLDALPMAPDMPKGMDKPKRK